jgi:hypothetical protein
MTTKEKQKFYEKIKNINSGKWVFVKKDNSKKGDMFLNCRSCKVIITNDYRSTFDKRYCADCL